MAPGLVFQIQCLFCVETKNKTPVSYSMSSPIMSFYVLWVDRVLQWHHGFLFCISAQGFTHICRELKESLFYHIIIIIVASNIAHMSVTQWRSCRCNIQYFLQDLGLCLNLWDLTLITPWNVLQGAVGQFAADSTRTPSLFDKCTGFFYICIALQRGTVAIVRMSKKRYQTEFTFSNVSLFT